MTDLKLDLDEGILLQTTDVERYSGNDENEIYEFYLTNKNLICVYDKSTGIFSKEQIVAEKIPLDTIRVVNGIVQVKKVDDEDYGDCLRVLYKNGKIDLFELSVSPRREYPKWESAISEAVLLLEKSSCDKKDVSIEDKKEEQIVAETKQVQAKTIEEKKYIFCCNCGEKLIAGSKFCNVCGTPTGIGEQKKKALTEEPIIKPTTERKTVYEGELHKCPNCGDIIDAFETVCQACGYEIRGRKISSVVHELALKLENTSDIKKKEELVRNFYIPNTKEDIYEFFILAISNINSGSHIVEAWYAKLEQAYQKAKLSFCNAPEFQYINQLYSKAKKEQGTKSIARSIKKSKALRCILLAILGAVMIIAGNFCGSMSGDSDSPFYMIALLGFFLFFGAGIYAMSNSQNDKK